MVTASESSWLHAQPWTVPPKIYPPPKAKRRPPPSPKTPCGFESAQGAETERLRRSSAAEHIAIAEACQRRVSALWAQHLSMGPRQVEADQAPGGQAQEDRAPDRSGARDHLHLGLAQGGGLALPCST
mmetsp:Transcript_26710/g.60391  ORF Transcript_26710/g.60391 Transcript_26710/m.60391 type:complete len:128 (-) Transcript_26710:161-544(-)